MQIKYLSHSTTLKNLIQIVKNEYLYTSIERDILEIQNRGLNAPQDSKNTEEFPYLYEFPGIFLSWHTGYDAVSDNIVLVFGADLLKMQKNYHLNLIDCNGYFTESITYFPEDIDKIPSYKKVMEFCNSSYNEVIFHDKIHIDLIEFIWFRSAETLMNAKKLLPSSIAKKCKMIPKNLDITVSTSKKSLNKIDSESEAVRVYVSNERYTGIKTPLYLPKQKKIRYKSSLKYVKDIARKAGVAEEQLKKLKTNIDVESYLEKNDYYFKAFESRLKQNMNNLICKENWKQRLYKIIMHYYG